MNYLLDTCVLSGLVKPRPAAPVLAWMAEQHAPQLFVSAITLAELKRGVTKLAPSRRQDELSHWLVQLAAGFDDRVLAFDEHTATHWAMLCANAESMGKPLAAFDSLIAATALQHQLCLVTRNLKDFDRPGLTLFNPWASAA